MNSSVIEIKEVDKTLPVFSTNISQHNEILSQAVEGLYELQQKTPEPIKSNVKANYVSSWISHKESPKFKPLCDLVISCCREISKKYFNTQLEFAIYNCWGMIYEGGDHAVKHSHFPSTFAAVVYIDVDENSAPIVFEDKLTITPVSGSLVIFPAILQHHVLPTNSRRIVIAMNIDHIERAQNE